MILSSDLFVSAVERSLAELVFLARFPTGVSVDHSIPVPAFPSQNLWLHMTDLYAGLAIMAVVTVAVLLMTVLLTRGISRREATGTGVVVALLILLYLRYIWNQPFVSRLLPVSNLVVVSNWFPLIAAFLTGITWTHGYGTRLRRAVFGGTLIGFAVWSTVHPLLGSPPECDNRWDRHGICLQTSRYTCTAAAAATLLRQYGISAQESEMAELCLTRRGTTWLGLFRGLQLKVDGLALNVEVIECDLNAMLKLKGPLILSVGIDPEKPYRPEYVDKWGWEPGQLHTVVCFDQKVRGLRLIGDPAVGLEAWNHEDFRTLYRGRVVRLVRTDQSGSQAQLRRRKELAAPARFIACPARIPDRPASFVTLDRAGHSSGR